MSDPTPTPPAAVPASGLSVPMVQQGLLKIAVALVAVATTIVLAPETFGFLPPVVFTIAKSVMAIGTVLGLASPGLRKKDEVSPQAVVAGTEAAKAPLDTLNK